MIIRALDSDHDWEFGKGIQNYFIEQKAIMENIETRLLSFVNDCFFDKNAGIDWMRLLGVPNTQAELTLSCRAVVLQSYGVVSLNSISASTVGRGAYIEMNINTLFTSQFSTALEVPTNV